MVSFSRFANLTCFCNLYRRRLCPVVAFGFCIVACSCRCSETPGWSRTSKVKKARLLATLGRRESCARALENSLAGKQAIGSNDDALFGSQ